MRKMSNKSLVTYQETEEEEKANGGEKKKQMVGTAHYMAPEIIGLEETNEAVDWWALGIITFELITGCLPFNAPTPDEVFQKIVDYDITWPPIGTDEGMLDPVAHDFISALLREDPSKRLGSNGTYEVKEHEFFKDIEWDKIREHEPPFVPPTNRDIDTRNFDSEKQNFDISSLSELQADMNAQKGREVENFDSVNLDFLYEFNMKAALEKEKMRKELLDEEESKRVSNQASAFLRQLED